MTSKRQKWIVETSKWIVEMSKWNVEMDRRNVNMERQNGSSKRQNGMSKWIIEMSKIHGPQEIQHLVAAQAMILYCLQCLHSLKRFIKSKD